MEELIKAIKHEMEKRRLKADAYIERGLRTETAANDGAIDRVLKADSFGLSLRVFKDGKMGSCFTTLSSPGGIPSLFDRAAGSAYMQGYGDFEPKKLPAILKLKIADPSFAVITPEKKQERALELESAVKNSSGRIKFVRDTTCVDTRTETTYINSAGADYTFAKTYSYAFTSAVASDGKSDEVADGFSGSVNWSGVDIKKLGEVTGKRAAGLLGGSPVASGRYNIILPPQAAVEFLQVISPMFSGTNLRKGKTLLKDVKKGDALAPEFISVIDDALLDGRPGGYPVDGEGTPGSQNPVILNGVFNTFLYDIASAAHLKACPTGNGVRQTYKSMPETGVSNFYVANGTAARVDFEGIGKAIIVNSLMGLHMTDTVSGNFSLGANGWLFEGGENRRAVKEILLTGNVKDFLSSIVMAGDDLEFFMNFGSPTIAVRDIMVAGK